MGVEAVIDKDRTACLLAKEVGAHALVMLTDVPNVQAGFGTPEARPLGITTPAEWTFNSTSRFEGSNFPRQTSKCRRRIS